MTQEERHLLNTALLSLLPYNTKVLINFEEYLKWIPDDSEEDTYKYKKNLNFVLKYYNKTVHDISNEPHTLYSYPCTERFGMLMGYEHEDYGVPVEFIKPYLRPLSSMTEEEKKDLSILLNYEFYIDDDYALVAEDDRHRIRLDLMEFRLDLMEKCIGWFNSHHFDHSGLIPMGLAIEAGNEIYGK
jgi:hypothetical protein